MKVRRKMRLLLVTLAVAMVFAGWKIKPVELIDDKLLIDLDVQIQDAGWGQEDSPDDSSSGNSPEDKNPEIDVTVNPEENAEIMVVIRGEKILVNEVHIKTISTLEKYLDKCLEQQGGTDIMVCLVDDYAEAHVYKKVYSLLGEVQARTAMKISEVMTEG